MANVRPDKSELATDQDILDVKQGKWIHIYGVNPPHKLPPNGTYVWCFASLSRRKCIGKIVETTAYEYDAFRDCDCILRHLTHWKYMCKW